MDVPVDPDPLKLAWIWTTYSWLFAGALGLALGVLSISLWFNFIVTRRLNQYTAGVMQVEMHLDKAW